ncbi:MAG: glycosyltransferase family 39 protein [Pseudomonadales bacterium]|nr:glycosyltransferase family 39 protein [Pseudomonadales bacterium]
MLGHIPWGFQWDEASYAYNAYSILKTGKDEWGVSMPIFLEAFGDFKPALLSYLMIPFFTLFSVNEFFARLPVVLLASLGVVAFYYIVKKHTTSFSGALAAVIMAITPWHMHYSRIAFDPMVSLSFLLIGLAFFQEIHAYKKRLIGIFFFLLAMYTYNASRFFVPLLIVVHECFFTYSGNVKRYFQENVAVFLAGGLSVLLIFVATFGSSAGDRARTVFFWNKDVAHAQVEKGIYRSVVTGLPLIRVFHNKGIYIFDLFFTQYLSHFSPGFLFPHSNQSPAYAFYEHGSLLYFFIPFLFLGLMFGKKDSTWWFFLAWLLVSPIPSSLTNGAPNGNRALIMVPALVYFTVVGIVFLYEAIAKKLHPVFSWAIWLGIVFGMVFNVALYLRDFYLLFPEQSEPYWHGFYSEAARDIYVKQHGYDNVFMSETDTQVYIFFAWYNLIDPVHIQSLAETREHGNINGLGRVENITITTVKSNVAPCMLKKENSLLISAASDGEMFPNGIKPVKEYYHLTRYQPQDQLALRVYDSTQFDETERSLVMKLCDDATAQ